ncbi:embryonic stem cell-specific 5-hydroxymethylcytosine-binding protein isoform X4 [Myotis lucifugus]|uniref:embryonic stem cell-specific 5-hydroxymethylcytosine-binding protein isoform X4 n=1 Tax=Myotis lucifugus TaxID=59463 RepID=UPI000CCBFB6C|nr:embryonic stem cell-specific 5-hydroxymethylcytosine-binding protein isoform X4 [Myotis lucifugus]
MRAETAEAALKMCGRTSCHLPRDALTRACAYRDRQGQPRLPEWRDPDRYRPSYNKSPQSDSPVLLSRLHFEKGADSSERIIAPMRWGLVPSWFKEDDPSKLQFNTSNCRSDTIMEKRSFKVPLGKGRRCVVLADGFYEWQRCQNTSHRQPYFIYFPQIKTEKVSAAALTSSSIGAASSPEDWEKVWDNWRLLTMAGIFDCWEPPQGGDCLYSYTIITVDSCKGLNDIHHRSPRQVAAARRCCSGWPQSHPKRKTPKHPKRQSQMCPSGPASSCGRAHSLPREEVQDVWSDG